MEQSSDAARPPFVYWTCLWAAGLAFASVAVAYDIFRPDLITPPGRDFANLYTGGRLAIEGRAYLAFDLDSFRLALREFVGTLTRQNYSYPPHALFIALPFALLPYGVSFALWSALSLGFFYWAAKPYVRFAPVLSVLTPAAALNLWNGHYGLVLGALWLLFFRLLEKRPLAAGLVASVMTFKPHMGLFIGLASFSKWRTLLGAIAGIFGLVALSVWAFDPASWYGFVGQTLSAQTEILTRSDNEFYFRMMPSAFTAYGREGFAIGAQLVVAAAALVMLYRYRRIDPFVLATATFLVVPYVFVYDMTVACLGFAIIIWRDWGELRKWEKWVLTLAFLLPVIALGINRVGTMFGPPILLTALFIQIRRSTGEVASRLQRQQQTPDAQCAAA